MKIFKKGILKMRSKKLRILLIALILLIAVAAFFVLRPLLNRETAKAQMTATVSRGSIVRTIEGSGVIAALDQYTISSLVTGEVLTDTFEEGDMVEKDALLYTIDQKNIDYNIEKAESNVDSARLSYEESLETKENMTVKAPFSGVLSTLTVKEGDEISAGKSVGSLMDADHMLLTIPFLSSDAASIFPGDIATVIPESMPYESLDGTVTSVSTGSIANTIGVAVSNVEIRVSNPGGLLDGSRATATVGTYACNDAGTLSYAKSDSVTVKTGGTVTGLSVKAGDRIEKGQVLFTLESDSTLRSIERSRISYNDSLRNLENTYDQLEDYQIKAPIAGKVIQKNVKAGDKLENGSGGNASSMAIIADLSVLTFEMAVDELDISDIREEQIVRITADAVPGRTFWGKVDNVSIVGTTSNGVTSYPVKVTLDGEENAALIPGMNVSATIIIEEKNDILLIPASSVNRGNLVLVKGENTDAETPPFSGMPKSTSSVEEGKMPRDDAAGNEKSPSGMPHQDVSQHETNSTPAPNAKSDIGRSPGLEAPEGYRYVRIETGITDGTYIEVVSGLSEGDEILLPESQGNANSAVTFTNGAMGNMSMPMGGGMPMSGGMPMGGGMSRGMSR